MPILRKSLCRRISKGADPTMGHDEPIKLPWETQARADTTHDLCDELQAS